MQCPPKIAELVAKILRIGLLRIRNLDDAARCRLEADHLHNLPGLLADFRPELLDYYWTVERACYLERSEPEDYTVFQPLWNSLAEHLDIDDQAVAAVQGR